MSIGTDENPIQNIYVSEIEIDGNLIIEGDNVTIGGNATPVDAIFVNSAYVYETLSVGNIEGDTNYVFPSSRTGNADWYATMTDNYTGLTMARCITILLVGVV